MLADFPDFLSWKKKGFLRTPLQAGEGVEFREDLYALVATVSGYPSAQFMKQDEGPDLLMVHIAPVVKVSHNKMQAFLVIHPILADLPSLQHENLSELIEEAGVTFGIDENAVSKAQKLIDESFNDFIDIAFAQGIFPGEGQDASLCFELEIGPLAGHLLKDGTIDFRDRKIMVGVAKDQHIATKIPALPGQEGYNVFGEVIESKSGKDIQVKVQGEAQFIPEENRVVATADGAMSVVNQNTISVAAKSTISGDVTYTTGNIESENNII
ncbi:MAG: FapA family protein, partial [Desulfopila sp.]|nr:FapA family protein [Desulfopila sp.]